MDWTKYFCCALNKPRTPSLQNLIKRHYATKNIYSLMPEVHHTRRCNDNSFKNVRFFRTNSDYIRIDDTELTYSKGDVIEVNDAYENHYLHRARHLESDKIGFISRGRLEPVPIVELQPWFFHNITRSAARILLLNSQEIGTFLVRKSSSNGQKYSLSIRSENKDRPAVVHYQIHANINGYYISEGFFVRYLDGLIKAYQDDIHGYLGLNPGLTNPCQRPKDYEISLEELKS